MFSIGFFELATVMVVALLVLGPARIPEAVHSVIVNMGKVHRQWAAFQTSVEQCMDERGMNLGLQKELERATQSKTGAALSDVHKKMQDGVKPQHFFDLTKLTKSLSD